MSSTIQAVLPAKINFRYLQQQQIQALKTQGSYYKKMILNRNSKEELQWWIKNLKLCSGRYLIQSHSQLMIQTDSSRHPERDEVQYTKGYQQGGECSKKEQLLQVNVLELEPVKLALLTFSKQKPLKAVHFQIDKTIAGPVF